LALCRNTDTPRLCMPDSADYQRKFTRPTIHSYPQASNPRTRHATTASYKIHALLHRRSSNSANPSSTITANPNFRACIGPASPTISKQIGRDVAPSGEVAATERPHICSSTCRTSISTHVQLAESDPACPPVLFRMGVPTWLPTVRGAFFGHYLLMNTLFTARLFSSLLYLSKPQMSVFGHPIMNGSLEYSKTKLRIL